MQYNTTALTLTGMLQELMDQLQVYAKILKTLKCLFYSTICSGDAILPGLRRTAYSYLCVSMLLNTKGRTPTSMEEQQPQVEDALKTEKQ